MPVFVLLWFLEGQIVFHLEFLDRMVSQVLVGQSLEIIVLAQGQCIKIQDMSNTFDQELPTPINCTICSAYLEGYDKLESDYLLNGFSQGVKFLVI